MHRVVLYTLILLILSSSRLTTVDDDFLKHLSTSFQQYQAKFLREKVFLHIDRTYYQPGDDLWFKAYTVNSLNNKLSVLSKTLYVSLVTPGGEIVQSGQFFIRNGRAFGDFELSPSLESGQYELIAYSSWMKNFDPEYVFRQKINVRRDIIPNVFIEASFGKELYQPGDDVKFSTNVVDLEGNSPESLRFSYSVTNGFEELVQEKVKTNDSDNPILSFEVPNENGFVNYLVRIDGEYDGQPFQYQWLIPTESREFDLQFMPEGGNLLSDKTQKVAFKCIDDFGRAIDFKGVIKDDIGNVVDTIISDYAGMGSLDLKTEPGRKYFAEMVDPVSTMTYPIGDPMNNTLTLSIDKKVDESLHIQILTNRRKSEQVYLTAIHQDNLVWSTSMQLQGDTTISIDQDVFPVGVNRISLIDSKRLPVAERLVFMHPEERLNVDVELNESSYAPRSKVEGRLKVTDSKDVPVKGVFSLAVTDGYLSNINSTDTKNIMSTLLLTSELKGDVPTPDYYFMDDNPYAEQALDLVMLTNGWRRFLWDYLLLRDLENEPAPINQDLKSGTVYDKKGNIVTGAEVQIVQLGEMNAYFTETDERGKFYLPFQISSRQSMNFVFNANLPGKTTPLEVRMDTEDNDPFRGAIISELLPTQGDLASTEKAREKKSTKRQKAKDVFRDFQFGGNYTLLREVEVIGRSLEEEEYVDKGEKYELRNQMSVMSHYFVQSREVDELNFVSNVSTMTGSGSSGGFIDLVRQITNIYKYNPETGFVILRTNDILRNSEKRLGALVVLNGSSIGQDLRALNHLTSAEIEKIDVVKSSAMAVYYGNRAAAGAILVTTKQGIKEGVDESYIDQTIESKVAVDNNYSTIRRFYAPKYAYEEDKLSSIPDARKTLYWHPELVTDENGEAKFSFYTDDRETLLNIEVQGMSGEGLFGFQNHSMLVEEPISANK
ncbi:MAG: hypothetical protein AAGC88_01950 [Bacteroidota bacterium]